ncbi:hypothetical protein [Lysinibacillus xylanilyticus]|uniref:hypothetical protein n=1 Tax=Lysinibacillus xylanilyticus TaxID=582475 RepID=UPI0038271396
MQKQQQQQQSEGSGSTLDYRKASCPEQKSFLLKVPKHSQILPNHFVFQHKKTIVHFFIHNSFSSYAWNG